MTMLLVGYRRVVDGTIYLMSQHATAVIACETSANLRHIRLMI